jgi:hypothetical protein
LFIATYFLQDTNAASYADSVGRGKGE